MAKKLVDRRKNGREILRKYSPTTTYISRWMRLTNRIEYSASVYCAVHISMWHIQPEGRRSVFIAAFPSPSFCVCVCALEKIWKIPKKGSGTCVSTRKRGLLWAFARQIGLWVVNSRRIMWIFHSMTDNQIMFFF